ncbi:MAG: hypothetical protein V4640_15415 [Verrucomicrobiota bacterium]
MKLDEVTAEIRPRGDWEAVDLGFAMVRRDFWRCFIVWWMAMALPTAAAWGLLWNHPFWLLVVFWWLKPAGSRMVLFEISRRLFGEQPPWKAVWRELPRAWTRRFFHRFVVARLSPWLALTMPVEDLEGLRGAAYRQRCRQLVRRGESPVMWIYLISQVGALWFGFGILLLVMMIIPEGQDGAWRMAMEMWQPMILSEMPLLVARVAVACVMLALMLGDLFATGAGFGLYLNNRTWLEGWDVELAFRRLAQRLGKVAVVVVSLLVLGGSARGQQVDAPADRMEQVLAHPDFVVHTVMDRVPVEKDVSPINLPLGWVQSLLQILFILVVAILLGFLGRLIWRHRHAFLMRRSGNNESPKKAVARVVMGMEVTPDSLPEDVPMAVWKLWQDGRQQDAMGLLYRGAISQVMEVGRVEIQESDTEGDCLRRVLGVGEAAHPGYFRSITDAWTRLAYAGMVPAEAEVWAFCQEWPFGEGRRG